MTGRDSTHVSKRDWHESEDAVQPATRDRHRAIVSLMEELEAVDWYNQRIDAAGDEELRETLRHNRDEEKEHASMVLEWLRRQDPAWDRCLRAYLFTDEPIRDRAEALDGAEGGSSDGGSGSLGLGSLSGKETL